MIDEEGRKKIEGENKKRRAKKKRSSATSNLGEKRKKIKCSSSHGKGNIADGDGKRGAVEVTGRRAARTGGSTRKSGSD